MGMYRDSQLGLCVDLAGPDGNVFALLGIGNDLARQLDCVDDWKGAIEAAKLMGGEYMTMVNMFEKFFPVVTLVNKEIVSEVHEIANDITA